MFLRPKPYSRARSGHSQQNILNKHCYVYRCFGNVFFGTPDPPDWTVELLILPFHLVLWLLHVQHMLTNIQQLCGHPTATLTFKPATADVPRWCYSPNNQNLTPQFRSKTKYPNAMHEVSYRHHEAFEWIYDDLCFQAFVPCTLYFVGILTCLRSRNQFGPRSHLSKSSSCFAHLAWSYAVWRMWIWLV